jgi:hypothetical protein
LEPCLCPEGKKKKADPRSLDTARQVNVLRNSSSRHVQREEPKRLDPTAEKLQALSLDYVQQDYDSGDADGEYTL